MRQRHENLTLDPQQFRHIVGRSATGGPREGSVDSDQCFVELPGLLQAFRQRASENSRQDVVLFGVQRLERVSQQIDAGSCLVAGDGEFAFLRQADGTIWRQRVSSGIRDQSLDDVRGPFDVATPEKDRSRIDQRDADRNRMIAMRCFVDGLLCCSERLLRKAAQPQGAGEGDKRADTMIVAKEAGIELAQLDGPDHAVFEMALRCGLISHQMMRNTKHPVCHDKTGRVLGCPSDRNPLFCDGQCAAEVANSREEDVQTGEKLQLMIPVLEGLRKGKSPLDCCANLVTVSFGEH